MGGVNYLTASLNRHIPQSEYAVVHVLCISYLLYLLIVIFWLIQSEARVWCCGNWDSDVIGVYYLLAFVLLFPCSIVLSCV